jgi:LacI family transcriptional regulator
MRKSSKLSEVAKIAGVSPITASRAIRGVGYVSESARERIMAAAAQLNYTPDMLARRMRGDKSNLIGVFVNNYGSLVLHEITRAISAEARARGYDILLFNAERFDSPARAGTVDMLSKLCDGLLLVMPNGADGYLDVLEQHRMPCVLVHFDARPVQLPVVALENRNGARLAVEHLLALGHRRIAFMAGTRTRARATSAKRATRMRCAPPASAPTRRWSWRCVCQAAGVPRHSSCSSCAGRRRRSSRPTTRWRIGAIDAIHSRGLKVPADISVIGFDDIPTVEPRVPAADDDAPAAGRAGGPCRGRRGHADPGRRGVAGEDRLPDGTGGPAVDRPGAGPGRFLGPLFRHGKMMCSTPRGQARAQRVPPPCPAALPRTRR